MTARANFANPGYVGIAYGDYLGYVDVDETFCIEVFAPDRKASEEESHNKSDSHRPGSNPSGPLFLRWPAIVSFACFGPALVRSFRFCTTGVHGNPFDVFLRDVPSIAGTARHIRSFDDDSD